MATVFEVRDELWELIEPLFRSFETGAWICRS